MALLEYIKDQLLFKDIVTLPGLGSFEIRRNAARIQGRNITPPEVFVVFNPERSLDDGSLAKSIAAAEDSSIDEAVQKVLEYVDEILFALNKGEEYVFDGFGVLHGDSANVLRFERNPAFQIEFESYGLESFELDPIENSIQEAKSTKVESVIGVKQQKENVSKQTIKSNIKMPSKNDVPAEELKSREEASASGESVHVMASAKENKNNRNIFWILTGAVMVILVSFIIIRMSTSLLDGNGLSIFNSGQNTNSKGFPEDENWDVESDLNSELGDAIDSMTMQENALTMQEASEPKAESVAEETGYSEFHIIAGSFKDKVNAGVLQQELTLKGYPALVIQQGEKLYRVSAISFKNKEQGLKELNSFKQKTKNNAAWLLRLK